RTVRRASRHRGEGLARGRRLPDAESCPPRSRVPDEGGARNLRRAASASPRRPDEGRCACMAREKGQRLISRHPNVRAALIPDGAAYRRRLQGWLHSTDLAKVSRADLAWLYPGERCESVARRRRELGPALVVVTCGADGCSAFTRSRALNMPAVPV